MSVPWEKLAPDEKMERRFAAWQSTEGIEFVSPEAESEYIARVRRMSDAIQLKKTPDRVPVTVSLGSFAAFHAGYTPKDMMYDPEKAVDATIKATLEFQPDTTAGAGATPGEALDILDYRLYDWPGHGLSPDSGIQFNEGEYMKPEEYDALIADPSDFWQRVYLPRISGALEPFRLLQPFSSVVEIPGMPGIAASYAQPEVEAAFQKLFAAGRAVLNFQQHVGQASKTLQSLGFPGAMGGSARAPFDVLGDTMRGTRGIMMDMYRRPAQLLEALDRLVPLQIQMGLAGARLGGPPFVGMPLHKGADGWMSDQQFRTFYWPSLRKVMLGLIVEGLVPRPFAEGAYNSRLETVREDLPKGKTVWYFDYTDMARAKSILGDVACLQGNVPVALIHAGTPEDVRAYCKELISTAGKGGGFILSTGAGIDGKAKPENIHALIDSAKEYGIY